MSRRGNGEGNVRQKADGRWEASVQLSGRRYWTAAKTQAEVRRKLKELQRQHAVGELVPPSRVTVGEHLQRWLDTGRGDWKPKTYAGYATIVRTYWEPALGNIRLQHLTPSMIALLYERWRVERSIEGGTLLNVHRCLHRALKVAVRWGLIPRNPADGVEPPKARRRRPVMWTAEEAARFLDAHSGTRWSPLWSVLLGTGCRIGEALALRWSDVDLDASLVHIERSVAWVGGQAIEGSPKTEAGRRDVTLPGYARKALREWRPKQAAERLATGPDWTGDARVFTQPDGSLLTPWRCLRVFRQASVAAKIPQTRIHDLRHLSASLLLAAGVPVPTVSARLGHASTGVTTTVYAHALIERDDRAVLALDAAFDGARALRTV